MLYSAAWYLVSSVCLVDLPAVMVPTEVTSQEGIMTAERP